MERRALPPEPRPGRSTPPAAVAVAGVAGCVVRLRPHGYFSCRRGAGRGDSARHDSVSDRSSSVFRVSDREVCKVLGDAVTGGRSRTSSRRWR
jgi:hypothetical protein